MFVLLAAGGVDFDASLDELHELEQAEEDLAEGEAWARSPDYWERIKETLLKHSSSKDIRTAVQEWTRDGHVFFRPGGTCELCGKVPIAFHFPIRNKVTDAKLIVGCECVVNHQQLAGPVDLKELRKKVRRQMDLLRAGKASPEALSTLEEAYKLEKQLRLKLALMIDTADLDVTEYRNSLQAAERVGQILKVQSTAFKVGREIINACRNYLKFQDEVRKRQKYEAKGIGDLIGAIMRQKKGDFAGQIDQLNQVNRLMTDMLSAGKPNEVIARMWRSVSDQRNQIVSEIQARGDQAKAELLAKYADELVFTKSYPYLHFTVSNGVAAYRDMISKQVETVIAALTSESLFDDLQSAKGLPVSVNQKFVADLGMGSTNVQVMSAKRVVEYIDLIRKDFIRNVVQAIRDKYGLKSVKDLAGVKKALLRAADDSTVDADIDGANAAGKFVQLLGQDDAAVLEHIRVEVDDVRAITARKVYEQMSADLGIDIERVFKLYVSDNDVEKSMMLAILNQTWPAGRKLSAAMMGNIQAQLAKYSRVRERKNSMWAFLKADLMAPVGGKK